MKIKVLDKKKNKALGFTMMELLIVLVIIGLLAALVGPNIYKRLKPAKQTVASAQINNFMSALDNFFIDVGRYPTTQEGLSVLRNSPNNTNQWNGPYLKKEIPKDPWGNDFTYKSPGRNGCYEISSYGADGKEGGSDDNQDINSWESGE